MKYVIKEKTRIFKEFFRVDRVDLETETYKDGSMMPIRRYHLERPEVVALVLENVEAGTIVMVKQFRYSSLKKSDSNGWTTEIVGGLIDPGEEPLECAIRETLEETGYQVASPEYLTSTFASVGVSDELIYLYYGQVKNTDKVSGGGGLAHENEDILVLEIPFGEALEQVVSGKITDSKTILALQWLALKKAKVAGF
ncbi:MAG: NUDIX hydrolase [SAR324 cluster bacterium]|nr:NUDIX hydrolase [SAR324 cluster bacterium]